ncbi:murein-DD-endopeptidase [Alkalilimnicola ehrlichii MLHE-1]|uniref:Murein-DD-endopeptidase n=1 Tax=Alkalilimnicola ehrlichii (strain ATCC BAA-1101 / DSM 17681 / MLHE-1) TaxID=187272 RepID=Q0A648_ALKEH|nr:murein-DD-endopeptidase [Alkalilimnicola ehrlichii MLHE-1]
MGGFHANAGSLPFMRMGSRVRYRAVSRLRGLVCLGFALLLLGAWAPAAHTSGGIEREPLQLASVHAAAVYLDTGERLVGKRADMPAPIASLTKLMTALVVVESGAPLDEWLTIVPRQHAVTKNAYSRMRVDSRLPRGELVRLALMSSENLATYVLAHHHPGGRAAFIAAMNAKAKELGMTQTRFVDSSGLSVENVASANDLLKLLAAANEHEVIRDYSTTRYHTAHFRGPRYTKGYANTNPLVAHSRWQVGLSKTGYLVEAGRCLAMVAEMEGRPVALVFLNSHGTRSPLGDAGRFRRWLADGVGGTVAASAREYEQQVGARLESDG